MDASAIKPEPRGWLERQFQLSARGSSVGREIMGGLTSFAAMSYILVVNPAIMAAAGMDRTDLIMGTAFAAIAGSLLIGLLSNLPLALAPGMGSNIVFVYTIVKAAGVPWQAALVIVALSGFTFFLLSISKAREKIANEVPDGMRVGIQASIGLLIALIGLRGAGVVVASHSTLTGLAPLGDPALLMVMGGILFTFALLLRRVPGALILSIAVLTLIGFFVPKGHGSITPLPARLLAMPVWPGQVFLHWQPLYLLHHLPTVLPLLFYFLCGEFFSTLSSLIGSTAAAGLVRPDGSIPKASRAFAADALATMIGPMFGTSTVACYIESVTGVMAGARTGLASVVVALMFALALLLWPVIAIIPSQATAPALIMVGVLMMQGVARIDMTDFAEALPVVLMLLLTLFANNLILGMALGCFAWILGRCLTGRAAQVTATLWSMAAVFAVYLWVAARVA